MSEMVIMPKADWQAALDATRAKTGKGELIKSGELAAEIEGITGGGGKPFDCRSVTFMHAGEVHYVRSVGDGDTCADPVARGLVDAPTKESTAQYDYPHAGWSLTDGGSASISALANVTEDRTVYAAFQETTRYYTISFYDGETMLTTKQVAYGGSATYTPPAKDGYFFSKWDPEPKNITGDMVCYAQYKVDVDFATATWADIAAVSERGEAADYFKLGEKKEITFTDLSGTNHTMNAVIVGINNDQTQDGKTVGLTMSIEHFAGIATPNSSKKTYQGKTGYYAGGWASCDMRNAMNTTLLASMSSDLQSVIKEVKKVSNTYLDGTVTNHQRITYDKLWVPSAGEMGKDTSANKDGNSYPVFYYTNEHTGKIGSFWEFITTSAGANGSYHVRSGSATSVDSIRYFNTSNRYLGSVGAGGSNKLIFCFCV